MADKEDFIDDKLDTDSLIGHVERSSVKRVSHEFGPININNERYGIVQVTKEERVEGIQRVRVEGAMCELAPGDFAHLGTNIYNVAKVEFVDGGFDILLNRALTVEDKLDISMMDFLHAS